MAGNPSYASVTVSGYNASPPADDGSQVASNLVDWAKPKTKLTDPLKTAIESINSGVDSAIDAIRQLWSQYEAKATSFAVSATADDGKIYTVSAVATVTLPSAATAGAGFRIGIFKTAVVGTNITITPAGSETINGVAASRVLYGLNDFMALVSNGTNWIIIAHTYTPPAFLAYNVANQDNITAGGAVTIEFGTEIYDKLGNYAAGSYTFTAPVDGLYTFDIRVYLQDVDTAMTNLQLQLVTSNRTFIAYKFPAEMAADSIVTMQISGLADMEAADTAIAKVLVTGGGNQVDIVSASAATLYSYFDMRLAQPA